MDQARIIVILLLLTVFATIILLYVTSLTEKHRPTSPPTNVTSPILVVRNYNPQHGGFCWCLYNALLASHYANKYGMQLVVLYDEGLYLESNITLLHSLGAKEQAIIAKAHNNWWRYYFESPTELSVENWIRTLRHIPSLADYKEHDNTMMIWQWDRNAFNKLDRSLSQVVLRQCWDRSCTLLPHIREKVEQFQQQHQFSEYYMVGIAIRMSDKVGNAHDSEDNPARYDYEWILKLLSKHVQRCQHKQSKPVRVFMTTDEEPMIDYAVANWNHPDCTIVFLDAIRSPVNTSGLNIKSHLCRDDTPLFTQHPDCVVYRRLADDSVHRGMKDQSAYKKGQDVLIDVLCLSACQTFLRSRGNVSNIPTYLNPTAEVIDMADVFRAEH